MMRRGVDATTMMYWRFLENLRESGAINMFGAAPYLEKAFGLTRAEARKVVANWMDCYDPADYGTEVD